MKCIKEEARKRRRFPRLRSAKGQAFLEFLLILLVAVFFLRFVFFHRQYGFKGMLDRTMLRLGSHLEGNLKTGTRVSGGDGQKSLDPFAGTGRWSN